MFAAALFCFIYFDFSLYATAVASTILTKVTQGVRKLSLQFQKFNTMLFFEMFSIVFFLLIGIS